MTAFLHIFPLTSAHLLRKDEDNQTQVAVALQKLEKLLQPLLIYGDELCGKTLLLFQAAVSYANQDHHVTFISRRPLTRMPLSVHGMPRPEAAGLLKTLTFLYMSTAEELAKYCSSVHTRTLLPEVLIVDDLEYYLGQLQDPSPEAGAAKLCALLVDCSEFIRSTSEQKKCILLLGCRNYKKTSLSMVWKQFNINLADITGVNLKERRYAVSLQTKDIDAQITFTIQTGGLFLENVSFIT